MARRRTKPQAKSPSVAAFLSAFAVTAFALLAACAGALPRAWSGMGLTIESGSMSPTIKVGDVAVIKPARLADIKAGDVVAYATDDAIITHRVERHTTHRGNPALVTRGDANPAPDPAPVLESQLRGAVVYVVPKIGHVSTWVSQHLAAVIGAGIALAASSAVADKARKNARHAQTGRGQDRSREEGL